MKWLALLIVCVAGLAVGYGAGKRIYVRGYSHGQAAAVMYAEYRALATFDSALAMAGARSVWLETPRRVAFYSVRVCQPVPEDLP